MISRARIFRAVGLFAALSIAVSSARAQQETPTSPVTESSPPVTTMRPYGVGEKLVYDLAVGGAKV